MSLSQKYPNAYFEHWLAMYCINYSEINEETIKTHLEIYKQCEGEESLLQLKAEIERIMVNGDLEQFLVFTQEKGRENIELSHLNQMAEIINNGTV